MSEPINKEFLESLIDLEALYQNAPCGYFSFLPNGTIIKINKTLLTWLGFKEEEILHVKKITDLLSKGGAIYYEMFHLPLLKLQGQVNELNYNIHRNNGSSFPALVNSSTLKNEANEITAINATIYNITDRKKYEIELLEAKKTAEAEKNRFEILANLIPEIIWTASLDGTLDYVNQRFYSYFDFRDKTLNPEKILSLIHPQDRKKCLRAWISTVHWEKDFQIELRLENRFNGYQWHLIRAVPYRDQHTTIVKWFGSCTNIHENVIALQRKDEFINIASHELKTPITTLKAYNQLLARGSMDNHSRLFIERSASTLSNLEFLVSSLLDVSQINSGYFSLNYSTSSLREIIKNSIELVTFSYPSYQIIEEFNFIEDVQIHADKQRITQVMINLLSNAIKYSPEADKVIVRVRKSENGQTVKIEVRDFGQGIPPEKINLIFEKYYRVSDTKNNNRVSGLGLGLYIIQNIIQLHGSTIFVESQLNEGSTFYFSLPIQ